MKTNQPAAAPNLPHAASVAQQVATLRCTRCGHTADISAGLTFRAAAWTCPQCDRSALAHAAAAPLPTGAGDLTADMFYAGDTPLFNRAWAGGAL